MTYPPAASFGRGVEPKTGRRPGRPIRVAGWLLLLGSVIAGVICIVGLVSDVGSAVTSTFNSTIYTTPAQVDIHLDHGRHVVYSLEGSGTGTAPSGGVIILGPDGKQVGLLQVSGNTEVTRNGHRFRPLAGFDADTDGTYRFELLGYLPGDQVFVGGDIVESVTNAVGWLVGTAASGFFLLAAIVLLLVGYLRFRTPRPASAGFAGGPGQPAPGWYVDPGDYRYMRYWNGGQWTQDVHPRQ